MPFNFIPTRRTASEEKIGCFNQKDFTNNKINKVSAN